MHGEDECIQGFGGTAKKRRAHWKDLDVRGR
jgi:hypothetical protein